jgi:hypothetical protein
MKFIQHRLVDAGTNPVGLRMPRLGSCEVEFSAARYHLYSCRGGAPVLRPVIGEVRFNGVPCASKNGGTRSFKGSAAVTGIFRSYSSATLTVLWVPMKVC